MAGSNSYERGGQPRTVPDADAAAYAAMVREQREYNAKQAAAEARQASAKRNKGYWETHPGLGESLVPVWGSAREGIADYHEGDMVGAAANGALALTDLTGEGYVLKTLGKGGLRVAGSHAWGPTAGWMRRTGRLPADLQGHHWLIPQNQWGKNVPDWFKNQPWNIKALPKDVHKRMRGRDLENGTPKFNAVERYRYGTPTWWKVQNGVWGARGATLAQEGLNPAARDDR